MPSAFVYIALTSLPTLTPPGLIQSVLWHLVPTIKIVSVQKFEIFTVPVTDKNESLKFTRAIIGPEKGEIMYDFYDFLLYEFANFLT